MMIIRAFRASDQPAARALIEEGLSEHFGFLDREANPDLDDIESSYSHARGAFIVAEIDGKLVGTTGLVLEDERARLVRVGVDRTHRRSGVASELLDKAIELAAAAGARELVVYTQPEWADAMAFYRAHGFTQYGRDDIDVHLKRRI
jgi:ribosomal protein S18 acetylase RimI-like enzyme